MPQTYLAIAHIPVGEHKSFDLHLESLADLTLATPITGVADVSVVSADEAFVDFVISGGVQLVCDRCLSDFVHEFKLRFQAHFVRGAEEEGEWPIERKGIEVSEPIREEVIVNIPMKRLCQATCAGVSEVKGEQ